MHPNDGPIVSNFAVQPLEGEPITIHGDVSQTRSSYVDDLIEGFVRLVFVPLMGALASLPGQGRHRISLGFKRAVSPDRLPGLTFAKTRLVAWLRGQA